MKTLDQLLVGGQSSVKSVMPESLSAKLVEMGLYPGKKVVLVFKAPLGDPIAVDVEGYTLSLRKQEAQLIEIEP